MLVCSFISQNEITSKRYMCGNKIALKAFYTRLHVMSCLSFSRIFCCIYFNFFFNQSCNTNIIFKYTNFPMGRTFIIFFINIIFCLIRPTLGFNWCVRSWRRNLTSHYFFIPTLLLCFNYVEKYFVILFFFK